MVVIEYITPEQFGAKGNGIADDTEPMQRAADACVNTSGTLYLKNKYRVRDVNYTRGGKNFSVKIVGNYSYCGVQRSMVICEGEKYGFNIQNGKGCVVDGVFFTGSSNIGLCVDHDQVAGLSGSTGTTIRNCYFEGFETGIEYSPNKKSLNNECNFIERCVGTRLKTFFSGSQAQEKGNIIQQCKLWNDIDTCFEWRGQPGNYIIRDMNIAQVGRILNRFSGNYFPLYMENIFAEAVDSFGTWTGGAEDSASNMIINFKYPEQSGYFPDAHLTGRDVLFNSCNFRYYGRFDIPMLLKGNNSFLERGTRYVNPVVGRYANSKDPDFQKGYTLNNFAKTSLTINDTREAVLFNTIPNTDDIVIFSTMGNQEFAGMAQVVNSGKAITLKHISPGIKSGEVYDLHIYKSN